jgi:hypothetical protein
MKFLCRLAEAERIGDYPENMQLKVSIMAAPLFEN